ncbi:MAG: tRNA (adenosine(37)-N6)-threonylcarbamoyltransferase complex dimerization subunit type 1 TsaB [Eubacteriales bacterium]|nr:tRNA (adenosine(37)-N6)-threonylcarbamoyltransferase complex dimerization subunit type 1 TsaB [Eubacteriales bacterium]
MAYCLAVDTSGKTLSLALSEDERILAERFIDEGLTHSETFLPQLADLLSELKLSVKDLDYLAVTLGPGSYTGIRIGLASMKSLAWLLDLPLFAYSSLRVINTHYLRELTAEEVEQHFNLTLLDARSGRVFSALYKGERGILPIANRQSSDLVAELKDLFYLGRSEKPTLYVSGDGASALQEAYAADPEAAQHFAISVLTDDLSGLRAKDLAYLAYRDYKQGERPGWEEAEAIYASPTQAERVRRDNLAKVKIRQAGPEDVDSVHRIELACFSTPWSRKSLLHQLDPENKITRLFVACREAESKDESELKSEEQNDEVDTIAGYQSPKSAEEILAYGGYTLHFDEAEILNIAVLDQARQKGVGRKLLTHLMRNAMSRGAERMTLEVRESNEPARRLYDSMGFKPCGRRKNYYEKPREDALILLWQDKS